MTPNNYPIRNTLLAVGIAAGSLSLNACTTDIDGHPVAVTSPEESTPEIIPTTTPELEAAEDRLEQASHQVAQQILEDMANPASLSAGYNGNYYGNKRGRNDSGQTYSRIPEMYVVYTPTDGVQRDDRGLYINSITAVEAPNGAEGEYVFDKVSLSFRVSKDANSLDQLLASGQQLDIRDIQNFVTNNEMTLNTVETTHGGSPLVITELTNTGEDSYLYTYEAGAKGAGPVVIDPANTAKLDDMTTDIFGTEVLLRNGLN